MQESIWMETADAVIAHDLELAAHGGSLGLRDAGLLESALARPINIWTYAESKPSLAVLAAAYAFGISSNHPFIDGNKRTALLVSFAFLDVNGSEVNASQEDAFLTILGLAAGEISEEQLSQWFEQTTAPPLTLSSFSTAPAKLSPCPPTFRCRIDSSPVSASKSPGKQS
jgi:death-on-curing protein